MKAKIIQLDDTRGFYVRFESDEKKYKDLLTQLLDYSSSHDTMSHPVKAGTVCVIQCDEDKLFYRCRIERANKNQAYQIYLPDFGLYEDKTSPVFYKATPQILSVPDLANYCKFAFIRLPRTVHPSHQEALDYLTDLVETTNEFSIVDEDDVAYHVIVNENSKIGSLNQRLLAEGLASLGRNVP